MLDARLCLQSESNAGDIFAREKEAQTDHINEYHSISLQHSVLQAPPTKLGVRKQMKHFTEIDCQWLSIQTDGIWREILYGTTNACFYWRDISDLAVPRVVPQQPIRLIPMSILYRCYFYIFMSRLLLLSSGGTGESRCGETRFT
ncbi:unnamed protein product [Linum trigynum]|uniref:Uncharacterized protein n=1 Tax=Linum trigynum TaxID=586398 RepID=A0AAV2DB80_9ROSI